MRIVPINWFADPLRRAPEALLEAWPTLRDVACAASADGVRATVVQPTRRDAVIEPGGAFGALPPPGNAAAMARALIDWAARDRAALRCAARPHFESALSFGAVGAELRAAYRALLAAARGRVREVRP